jgi:hypothetical protein
MSTILVLLICINSLQAQTVAVKLDQIQLLKQFLGTWRMESTRGDVQIDDFTSFGTSMLCNTKIIHAGKLIFSMKSIWGYDKEKDKILIAQVDSTYPFMTLEERWFTLRNILVSEKKIVPDSGDTLSTRFEFQTPDLLLLTTINNNRDIETYKFTRIGK